ncbi:glycerophosphodiester phosphodiesterase [Streptomyces sp. NBC_01477]|uniref:glycerophosphodiester phosphodiesterase n=1 Tax=Streptomyces sp. NBC_01477 TaxID=2976015 RepID=UPI002E34825C|nr:glycerophosphodiester phosphodiesterase family protein [Streptomyces sp. NBC_01477]
MTTVRRPLVYGHRGSREEAPENTLRSFRRAQEVGADGVELDVRVSRDGRLVVIHDATVDRTTNGTGKVHDLTRAQMAALDAGEGEGIPTLTEALDAFPGLVQVEIKAAAAVPALAELDRSDALPDRVVLTSFHRDVLAHAAELLPRVRRGLITHRCDDSVLAAVTDLELSWVCPELDPSLTAGMMAQFRDRGVKVDIWPAADRDHLGRCVALGADAVTTDHPGLIDAWLGGAERA